MSNIVPNFSCTGHTELVNEWGKYILYRISLKFNIFSFRPHRQTFKHLVALIFVLDNASVS